MSDAVIAEGLTYEYDSGRALDAATMRAPKGEITALAGPNGAGKTTLMRILSGLMRPQEGRATVLGVDVARDPRAIHRIIGYVPDFIGLWDGMTARRHLTHAGRCAGLGAEETRVQSVSIAEKLNIVEKLDDDVAALSRGQQQRVAIAQALMKQPQLLILDEPASGLDPEARKGLSKLFLDLKAGGATLLISSHILSELDDYSDHVVILRGGRIVRTRSLKTELDAAQKIEIVFATDADHSAALAAALPGRAARMTGPGQAEVEATGGPQENAQILAALVTAGLPVAAFTPRRRRLEDAYFDLDSGAEDDAPIVMTGE